MSEVLAAEYEITLDDHVEYFMHFKRTNPSWRRYRIRYRIVMPIVGVALGLAGWFLTNLKYPLELVWPVFILFFVVFGIRFWLFDDWSSRRHFRKMLVEGKNRNVLGKTKMELRPSSIRIQTPLSEGSTQWQAVEDIQRTDRYLYLVTGVGSSFVIPRRDFKTDDDFNIFANRALELWRNARPA